MYIFVFVQVPPTRKVEKGKRKKFFDFDSGTSSDEPPSKKFKPDPDQVPEQKKQPEAQSQHTREATPDPGPEVGSSRQSRAANKETKAGSASKNGPK
jgi:hypothetical protein